MIPNRKPTAVLATGQDAASQDANLKYEEALAKLTTALDSRQNQMFDPTMLALSRGFGMPTKTGGFGESFSNATGEYLKAQQAQNTEDQDIARQRLELAGMGVQRQQAKSNATEVDKIIERMEEEARIAQGLPPKSPAVDPVAAPAGLPELPPPPAGAVQQALQPQGGAMPVPAPPTAVMRPLSEDNQPQGPTPLEVARPPVQQAPPMAPPAPTMQRPLDQMMRLGPPNTNILNPIQMARLMKADGKSPAEIMKAISDAEEKNIEVTQGRMVNKRENKAAMLPSGETVDTELFGYPGKTYKLPASVYAQAVNYISNNQPEKYAEIVKPYAEGLKFANKEAVAPVSLEDKVVALKERETRANKLGEAAATKEANLEENTAAARRIYGSTVRVEKALKESPSYFGIFERPGVVSAIGTLVKEGIQTPTGTLNLAGFEKSMTQLLPKVQQKDLDNLTKSSAELAEIELAFTRLYLAKQGAVTEGERKIVRLIPGSVSSSPEVLKQRMQLLKSRSQFDIDVGDAFRQFQEKNPGRSYLDFERSSKEYKGLIKDFEKETARQYDTMAALPTRQRQESVATSNLSAAKEKLNLILGN